MSDFRFHFASLYQERGYSVIPMQNGKPAIDWEPFTEHRAGLPQLAIWFGAAAHITYEVGIVTGSISDLIVASVRRGSIQTIDSPLIAEVRPDYLDFYFRQGESTLLTTSHQPGLEIYAEQGFIAAPIRYAEWLSWLDPYSIEDVPYFEQVAKEIAPLRERAP